MSVFRSFIVALVMSSSALAQSGINVAIPVFSSDDQPVVGLIAELVSANGESSGPSTTGRDDSILTFPDVEDGSYTLVTKIDDAFACPLCAILVDNEFSVTVARSDERFDEMTNTLTLSEVELALAPRIIDFTVISAADDMPAAGIDVNVFGMGEFSQDLSKIATTDSEGLARIGLPMNLGEDGIGVAVFDANEPKRYASRFLPDFELADDATTATVRINEFNASIGILVVDTEGSAVVLNEDEYLGISCFNPETYDDFTETITGTGDAVEEVVIPLFVTNSNTPIVCSAFSENIATTTLSLDISSGDSQGGQEITIAQPDKNLRIAFRDAEGIEIPSAELGDSIQVQCFASSETIEHFSFYDSAFSEGAAELPVITGATYTCSYFIESSENQSSTIIPLADGKNYLTTFEEVQVEVAATAEQELTFVLQQADSNLRVVLLGANGEPLSGFVSIVEQLEDEEDDGIFGFYAGEEVGPDGVVVPVIGDRTYFVIAEPFDSADDTLMPEQEISIASGDTETVTFEALRADATVALSVTVDTTESSESGGFCYFYNQNGGSDFAELTVEGPGKLTGSLQAVSGISYFVGCVAFSGENFFVAPETTSEFVSGAQVLEVSLASGGTYFEENVCFDSTQSRTIEFGEEVAGCTNELFIPASALANEGTVCAQIASAIGYSPEGNLPDVDNVFDVNFSTLEGEEITDFNRNPELRLCSQEEVGAANADEASFYGLSQSSSGRSWQPNGTERADGQIALTVREAGNFGLFQSRAEAIGTCSIEKKPKLRRRGRKLVFFGRLDVDSAASEVTVRLTETLNKKKTNIRRKVLKIKTNKKGIPKYRGSFRMKKKTRRARVSVKGAGCSDAKFFDSRNLKIKKK